MIKTPNWIVTVSLSLVLSACGLLTVRSPAGDSPADSEVDALEDSSVEESTAVPPIRVSPLPPLEQVQRPANAPWLLDPIDLHIEQLNALAALQVVLGDRPLRSRLSWSTPPAISYASTPHDVRQHAIESITSQVDWHWWIDNQVVWVSDLQTKTMPILAQPGQVEGSLSVNALDSGSSGGSEGSDGETVEVTGLDPYRDELTPLIQALIAADIRREVPAFFQLLPRANTLIITARPSSVRQVESLVNHYNDRTAKRVRVDLTVYEVNSTTDRTIGSRLAGQYDSGQAVTQLGWSAQPLQKAGEFSLNFNGASAWMGSELILQWLNEEGNATISLSDQIDVRNNRIASSSTTRTYQFIASISREQDQLGRVRTEVERDQLKTGWAVTIQPTIGLETVTVRLSLARRALVDERPFEFGETAGTNFVTDDQVRSMSVTLADGESRLITAFAARDERQRRSKLAGLVTRNAKESSQTESVILMSVSLVDD